MHAIVPRIDRLSWSDADVRALMSAIASNANVSDVHAAEQTALALQALGTSLTRRNTSLLKGPMMKSIDDLFAELQNRDDYDPVRFSEKLRALR